MISDFETASIRVWRKIQELGLTNAYIEFKLWSRQLVAFSFVPIQLVSTGLEYILDSIPKEPENAENLTDYFIDQWIEGHFPASCWNHASTIGPRTNNRVEGFHIMLNKQLGAPHPHVYKLITILQEITEKTHIDLEQRLNGASAPKRKNIWAKREENLENLHNLFKEKHLSFEDYLKRLTFNIQF